MFRSKNRWFDKPLELLDPAIWGRGCPPKPFNLAINISLSMAAMGLAMTPGLAQSLPQAKGQFNHAVGRTPAESDPPRWPAMIKPREGAPNVLLVLIDDEGFAASSTFGGLIPTPAFDNLAANGLKYNQFNTAGICSPTRASLLTGRVPQNVNVGNVVNFAQGYDGYNSVIPPSAATIAEVLKADGYRTALIGKAHVTPQWELGEDGPFDRWPTGLGFEYFYGFMGGDTDQFSPPLVENTRQLQPPVGDPTYHLDKDLANKAISWIKEQRQLSPDKPFFMYYAPGSSHSPHQAPADWLARFRGKFDMGWDAAREQIFRQQKAMGVIPSATRLTPRPKGIPAWSSLTANQKRIYARYMEAYAAQLAHCDYQIGRVTEYLRETGQLDNTLVIYIAGDNGASAEGTPTGLLYEQSNQNSYQEDQSYNLAHIDDIGGPLANNHYPAGWAWAMGTPFQWFKQVASHFGGVRNGMVMSWPKGIKDKGGLREQFSYVSDIAPTIYEAVGVEPPAVVKGVTQQPIDGISLAYTFDNPREASRRKTQVFGIMEYYGIYHDGWVAAPTPWKAPWELFVGKSSDVDKQSWELYNVANDFSEAVNLAKKNPKKLEQMKALFWAEAARNNILPIHNINEGADGVPWPNKTRSHYTFYDGLTRMSENAAPDVMGRSYNITGDVTVGNNPANGVLIAHGGRFGGYSLYFLNGKLVFHYNAIGPRQYAVSSSEIVAPGRHQVKVEFKTDANKPGAGGEVRLSVDGQDVGAGRIEHTLPLWISLYEGLDVGRDTQTPVSTDYQAGDNRFNGSIHKIDFNVIR